MKAKRGRTRVRIVVEAASGAIALARSSAGSLVSHVPGAVHATRVGGHATTSALQVLPDSTLRGLAAGSVGLAAGFYLAGVPRVVVAAGVAPVVMIAAAIALRPGDHAAPTVTNG
jgi:hypothetical protein